MLRHNRYALKLLTFLLLATCCLSAINIVLIPKYFYNADWGTTSTFIDFYSLKKNSVDVLFLGSSHCTAAFSPIELYEKYGIRSYNLGCEQQNLLTSYYWLQEALRFQKPQYVFLDTFMLFPYDVGAALNTSEATMRKAMDFMRWSPVKFRAVSDICAIDASQSFSNYLLPNERFHTRWKYLSEDDFMAGAMAEHESLMGFFPLHFMCNDDSFQPFGETGQWEYAEMVPMMKEYMEKIVMLCENQGIKLVLTKTPTKFYSVEAYHSVCVYAYDHQLEYIDFNFESTYRDVGLDFASDSCDTDHASIWGAMKISDYIGEWLSGKVPSGQKDEQWEKRAAYYHHYLKDMELKNETDMCQYLQLLQDENYSVFIAAMGDASEIFHSKALEELAKLGLETDLVRDYGDGYYAVIDSKKVLAEAAGREILSKQGTVRKGLVKYSILSSGTDSGNNCSVILNGDDFALKKFGLNIVVYCNDKKQLIDRVCFSVEHGEVKCYR